MKKRILAMALAVMMVVTTLPVYTLSAAAIDGEYRYYDYNPSTKEMEETTLPVSTTVNIVNENTDPFKDGWNMVTADVEFSNRITLPTGNVKIILANNIEMKPTQGITVPKNCDLTIYAQSLDKDVMGKMTGSGTWRCAGIGSVEDGEGGNITINGGSIHISGGYTAAGIGGGNDGTIGDITINGGVLDINGSYEAAGIGGGSYSDSCGNITINGGTINTKTSEKGAAIGTGIYNKCGNITITGGTITATSSKWGVGIGSGYDVSCSCGDITIVGGEITATAGEYGAGIGKTNGSQCGILTIAKAYTYKVGTNATDAVQAKKYNGERYVEVRLPDVVDATEPTCTKEGCKASYRNPVDSLYYEEETFETEIGDFTALCAWYAEGKAGFIPALGHNWQVTDDIYSCTQCGAEYQLMYYDYNASAHELEKKELPAETTVNIISDDADTFAAGWNIVAADVTFFDRIMLPQGDVKLILGNNTELIARRGINIAENSNLTIYAQSLDESVMGKLTIPSGGVEDYSAAIGSGYKAFFANITVNGGNIDATGGLCAPAIGSGGAWGGCGDITINGGKLKVTSGEQTAAIGGGDASSCGNILINGGDITATGGTYSPGIGSADQGSCGTITITGGHIISTGGYDGGSGIGSSRYGSCGHITITGGTVVATAGNNGAGIGSSNNRGKCGDIVIAGGMITATGNNAPAIGKGGDGNCGTVTIDKYFVMKAGSTSGKATSVTTYSNQTYAQFNEPDVVVEVAPTCTTDGNKAAYKNAENGLYYEEETFETEIGDFIALSAWLDDENKGFLPKLGHNWEVVDDNTHRCTRGDVETEDHVDENDDFICDVCLYDAEEAIKTAAKDWLTELAGENPSDAMKAVLAEACSKIDDAETPSDVEIEIDNGEDAIALRSAKDAGRTLLTEEAGENPSDKVKAILNTLLDEVEKATSSYDVEMVVEKGVICLHLEIDEITYYDYNDSKRALEEVSLEDEFVYEINDEEDEFVSGWNIVTANVTFEDRIVMPKNAKLIIANGVELTAKKGITVASDGWFAVYAQSLEEDKMGKLTVPANTIESGNAGIGTASKGNCGSITINGGKLTVQGGSNSAGIGSGDEGKCNSIAINGGVIAVTGGENGAGIGSGRNGKCGVVNINGGVITAIGDGTTAGIGSGIYGECGTITIDPTLSIFAGDNADEMMYVYWYEGQSYVCVGPKMVTEKVSPTCKTTGHEAFVQNPVNGLYYDTAHFGKKIGDDTALEAWLAEGGDGYLEIVDHQFEYIDKNTHQCIWCEKTEDHTFDEENYCDLCGSSGEDTYYDYDEGTGEFKVLSIPNDAVTLTESSTVLSSGYYVVRNNVFIDERIILSGNVHLILCSGAVLVAPLGITVPEIGGLTVHATTMDTDKMGVLFVQPLPETMEGNAGIGSECEGSCGSITIDGGRVIVLNNGEFDGAAIGSGDEGSCGDITINGGVVTAAGACCSAGIGAGYYGSCGDIIINGGEVNAAAGEDAAGIGAGYDGSCGNITINDGEVNATADLIEGNDDDGAGIGSGSSSYCKCGTITINGGIVSATGGEYGSGIGCGYHSRCGDIVINEGKVDAIGYTGIGKSSGSTCEDVTINGGQVTAFSRKGYSAIEANDIISIDKDLLLFVGDNLENAVYVDSFDGQCFLAVGYGVLNNENPATCQAAGHKAYIQNPLDEMYYNVAADGGECIGDATTLETWLAEGGDGYLEIVDHSWTCLDNDKHQCEWCKTTESHIFDEDQCEICRYSNADTYYDYNEEAGEYEELPIPDDAVMLTSSSTTLSSGYYVLRSDLKIDERIVLTGDVHLILCSDLVLLAPKGITVPADGSLTIYSSSLERTDLYAEAFTSTGGLCICDAEKPSDVYDIDFDKLISSVEQYNAGIGGTQGMDCGTITIDGGAIKVFGGAEAAAIGSGAQAKCAGVVINGGSVSAWKPVDEHGAGIGSGTNGICDFITINGGYVESFGGYGSAGIGAGYNGACGDITINGGDLYGSGINGGAGIGSGMGKNSSCGDITVNDGRVAGDTVNGGAGIGSGKNSICGTITFHGGKINAASFSTSEFCDFNDEALSFGGGAGIGSGCDGTCGDILFDGGVFDYIIGGEDYMVGAYSGAGIGTGFNGTCGDITIVGGFFKEEDDWQGIYGGFGAVGIGCGAGNASCGRITINLFKNGGVIEKVSSNHGNYSTTPAIGKTINGTCAGVDIFSALEIIDKYSEEPLEEYLNQPMVGIYLPDSFEDVPAHAPTCIKDGNKAAYFAFEEEPLYYEDETCETLIGDYDAMCAWLIDADGGLLPATGHTFVPADDGKTHICKDCEYTEDHSDCDGDFICDICDYEYLVEAKADATNTLSAAVGKTPSEALTNVLNTALANVEKAQTVAQVNDAKGAGLVAIAEQEKAEFDAVKTAAKNALEAAAGIAPSDAMTTILDGAKKAIDDAQTVEEVVSAQQAGVTAVVAQIAKEMQEMQAEIEKLLAQALANAKATAITELNNAVGENPSDTLKDVLNSAIANVNKANSVDAVDAAKEAGLAAIAAQKSEEQNGDVNLDGVTDIKDVLALRKYLVGIDTKCDTTKADMNRDKNIDMKDVLVLRKLLAGMIL